MNEPEPLATGVYQQIQNPPWNDPHTAAPPLWAFRLEDGPLCFAGVGQWETLPQPFLQIEPIRQPAKESLSAGPFIVSHPSSTVAEVI